MKNLYLSQTNKKLFGLCGGIGELYEIDANLVRLVVVFLGLATAGLPMLAAYLVGVLIVPRGT